MSPHAQDAAGTRIDARDVHFRELNQRIRRALAGGSRQVRVRNVCGQR